MNICEMTRRKIIMGKRATRIAACVAGRSDGDADDRMWK